MQEHGIQMFPRQCEREILLDEEDKASHFSQMFC